MASRDLRGDRLWKIDIWCVFLAAMTKFLADSVHSAIEGLTLLEPCAHSHCSETLSYRHHSLLPCRFSTRASSCPLLDTPPDLLGAPCFQLYMRGCEGKDRRHTQWAKGGHFTFLSSWQTLRIALFHRTQQQVIALAKRRDQVWLNGRR